ncbi:Protein of unknown function [Bacillus mycoides]|nr:Protein of unknown function [Bacillus mycoides]
MEDQFLSLLSYIADQERKKTSETGGGDRCSQISRKTLRTSLGEPFDVKEIQHTNSPSSSFELGLFVI